MKTEKREQTINDKNDLQIEALTDLPVTDDQADGARGGSDAHGRILIGTDGGVWR